MCDVRCLMLAVCCLLFDVGYVLFDVCCFCCLMFVVC